MSQTTASCRMSPSIVLLLCLGIASVGAQTAQNECQIDRRLARIEIEEGSPREDDWVDTYNGHVRNVEMRKKWLEVVFFGDSITEDMHDSETVKQYYQPNYNTAAYGIGGDRAYHIKWRVQNMFVDDLKPKVVSILAGINDIRSVGRDDELDVPSEVDRVVNRVVGDIQQMVAFIHKKSPCTKINLQAILPTAMLGILNTWPNVFTPIIDKVNQELEAFAKRHTMLYFTDACSRVFLSKYLGWQKPRYILEEKMGDLLHPSREGHADMAVCMLKEIRGIINERPGAASSAKSKLVKKSSAGPSERTPKRGGDSSAAPSEEEPEPLVAPKLDGYHSEALGKDCKNNPGTVLTNFPPILGIPACKRMCDLAGDCTAFVYKDTSDVKTCELYETCAVINGGMRDVIAFKGPEPGSAIAKGYCSYTRCPAKDIPFNLNQFCHKNAKNCEMACGGVFCKLQPGKSATA